MDRMTFPVAVHLFLLSDAQILMLRRFNTGYEDGNYSVVAGHIDGGENVYDAMIREAKEEAGIDIALCDLEAVQVMHRRTNATERVDYFFICRKWDGDIRITEPDKCDKLTWFDMDKLPENTVGYVRAAIDYHLKGAKFTLFGW